MSNPSKLRLKLISLIRTELKSRLNKRLLFIFKNAICSKTLSKKAKTIYSFTTKNRIYSTKLNRTAAVLNMTNNRFTLSKICKNCTFNYNKSVNELTNFKKLFVISFIQIKDQKVQKAYHFLEQLTKKLTIILDSQQDLRISISSRLENTFNSEVS